jgi:hypothetical protein
MEQTRRLLPSKSTIAARPLARTIPAAYTNMHLKKVIGVHIVIDELLKKKFQLINTN